MQQRKNTRSYEAFVPLRDLILWMRGPVVLCTVEKFCGNAVFSVCHLFVYLLSFLISLNHWMEEFKFRIHDPRYLATARGATDPRVMRRLLSYDFLIHKWDSKRVSKLSNLLCPCYFHYRTHPAGKLEVLFSLTCPIFGTTFIFLIISSYHLLSFVCFCSFDGIWHQLSRVVYVFS